jgi:hypothetical protein
MSLETRLFPGPARVSLALSCAIALAWAKPAAAQAWRLCAKDAGEKPAIAASVIKDPSVPGGDIFGFTSGTDLGEAGDCGIALELSGRLGKRDGTYRTGTLKTQLGATLSDNLAVAISPFLTHHRVRNVPDLDDRSRTAFDGLSLELAHRFIERRVDSALAATASVELRWARADGTSGERVQAYSSEFKLFLDRPLAERTYGAINLNYAPAIQRAARDGSKWDRSSSTNVSAAVTRDYSRLVGADEDRLFLGVEARYLASFAGLAPRRLNGHGLFVGPTILYRVSDAIAVNAVWTPQLWGRAREVPRSLDLENFERHQFRLKLVVGL